MSDNPLRDYFEANTGRLIHKWDHYLDVYHRHFDSLRDTATTVLEIGVYHGGSLEMWRDRLSGVKVLVGVDVDPWCTTLAKPEQGIDVVIGDQADPRFLDDLVRRYGKFTVVIDDGGHTVRQQRNAFDTLWPAVADGGLYLVEDLHTSYWREYGGGLGRDDTFTSRVKWLIDEMNAWHIRELQPSMLTRTVAAMHIYASIVVLEKSVVAPPLDRCTGKPSFPDVRSVS